MRKKNDGKGRIGGRQKGTPNKITQGVREWLSLLIDENREQIKKDLATLEPKDRLQILEKFMQYTVPKMQNIDHKIDFNHLTDYEITQLTDTILKQAEE